MRKRGSRKGDLMSEGMTALCGGALALNLLLVVALLAVLVVNGMGYFWQKELVLLELDDGKEIVVIFNTKTVSEI